MQPQPIPSTLASSACASAELVRLGVISVAPDRDVHPDDVPWWIAQQERAEIRAELKRSELL